MAHQLLPHHPLIPKHLQTPAQLGSTLTSEMQTKGILLMQLKTHACETEGTQTQMEGEEGQATLWQGVPQEAAAPSKHLKTL